MLDNKLENWAVVPERPGWGFSFDPGAIERYRAS